MSNKLWDMYTNDCTKSGARADLGDYLIWLDDNGLTDPELETILNVAV